MQMKNYQQGSTKEESEETIVAEVDTTIVLEKGRNLCDVALQEAMLSTSSISNLSIVSLPEESDKFEPPVTCQTLKALDHEVKDPPMQLLHELYFDAKAPLRDLGMPIDDTEYWTSLNNEIEGLSKLKDQLTFSLPCLEGVLQEIGAMLVYLYPESKSLKEELMVNWDVKFILDQLLRGHLNLVNLITTLCTIIKSNCAPKRDETVDRILLMGSQCEWIPMFKSLLHLITLMKIDLLNYRLVMNRKKWMHKLVPEEKKAFITQLQAGSITLTAVKKWISFAVSQQRQHRATFLVEELDPDILLRIAFVNCLDARCPFPLPGTFYLDMARMNWLQETCQHICIVNGITLVLRQLCGKSLTVADMTELKSRMHTILKTPEAKISDVGNQMLLICSRLKGKAVSGDDRKVFLSYIDNLLNPDHRIYSTIMQKLRDALYTRLEDLELSSGDARRLGFGDLYSEVNYLCDVANHLWSHHYRVYRELYINILRGSEF